jgi:hypothetical protein
MKNILAVQLLLASSLWGDTILSTFGPGDSYDTSGGGYVIGYMPVEGSVHQAFQFVLESLDSYSLDRIEVAIDSWGGPTTEPNSMQFQLMTDHGGIPGTVLETFSLIPMVADGAGGIVLAESQEHPILLSGATYWLKAARLDDSLGPQIWNIGSGATMTRACGLVGEPWYFDEVDAAAFRLSGTLVVIPEPASMAMILTGCLGFWTWFRRGSEGGCAES